MATKKQLPSKAVKAKAKSIAKKTAKPVKSAPKKVVKPAPAKKTVPKKVAAKKPASKKIIAKPVAKKPVAKPIVKKAPAKVAQKKPAAKVAPKKPVKPAAKVAPKKPVKPIAKVAPSKATPAKKAPIPAKKPITKNTPPKAATPVPVKKVEMKVPVKQPIIKVVSVKSVPEVKAKDIKVPAAKPVSIPKISTKTVRKYQPEFTKSVLDKAQRDPGAPSQRYSDGELNEFRELIQRKLEAAKKELSYLHGLITRKDELGGDEGDSRYMTMEDGSLSMEREQLSQMASRQVTFIDHLEKAIMRIENKTYGICRVTGKLIDKARLRAVPHATLSIEAKMSSNK